MPTFFPTGTETTPTRVLERPGQRTFQLFKLSIAGLVIGISFLALTAAANAQSKVPGASEFLNSCSACHGGDGRGDGPVAPYLSVAPPDLTRLSERNDGQFPFLKVFMIIDGRTGVRAHGTETMPVWGDRYRQQVDPKSVNPLGSEQIVRGRILELVNYLASIQTVSDKNGVLR